jgi:two-component system LytT family sensor kinase
MVNKVRLYWTLQITGWVIYALLQIVFSIIATEALGISSKRILFHFSEALICLLVTHGFRYFIKRWRWIERSLSFLIPRVITSVIVLGVFVYFIRIPTNIFLWKLFDPDVAFTPSQILYASSFYAFMLFLWSVFYFTYHYFERYNKSLKYEASMVQIELNNLRSQLNPHFIFNALNSIRALVDENPSKSKKAINQLSNILRNSLTAEKKGLTKFEDELRFVQDYLGLESIRFEERLKIEFDIDAGSQQFLVPPLMIQTLVENGIKHGISKLKEGGIVQLKTSVNHGNLKIQIRNSGHMANGTRRSKGSGLGISNTIQRLKLIYGDHASFRIANENNNFVLTELIIPQTNSYESINRG